jgi:hypothetical protein
MADENEPNSLPNVRGTAIAPLISRSLELSTGGREMKFGTKLAVSSALLFGVAMVGPGICATGSSTRQSPNAAVVDNPHMIRRSVIKVHTDHGVITMPGKADSWDQVENAVFVADSIADVQFVNNEVPWKIRIQ